MSKSTVEGFTIPLHVTIRLCRREDLPDLEWFGMFSQLRQIFLQAYGRQEQGEVVMLVAEANGFPVGQVWIDLVKRREDAIGVLWALRVLLPLQNLGIGTRLITAAEADLRSRGFRVAEIGVEKENPGAKRLYERLGYHVVGEKVEEWGYTTPEGRQVHEVADEWIMHKAL